MQWADVHQPVSRNIVRDSIPRLVLYSLVIAGIVTSFLAQMLQGDCPVP
jgi:hypothetical protein